MRAATAVFATALFALLSRSVESKLVWDEIDYANTNLEKHSVLSSATVFANGKEVKAGFKALIRSGVEDPRGSGAVFGQVLDQDGQPMEEIISDPSPRTSRNGRNESTVDISHDPDFVSFMTAGDKVFLLAHFESPNPGSSYLIETEQGEDGELSVVGFEAVDWSSLGGLWTPCAGSVSPWGTHLGSEEFSPNAKQINIKDMMEWDAFRNISGNSTPFRTEEMMRYFGIFPDELTPDDVNNFKPYRYGYPWEVAVNEDGTYTNVKHYSMGRTSIELPFVMPDKKTVYITDDGANRVFTMFVADKEEDLTCGVLYAAKATQVDGDGGGIFNLEWIQMGGSVCDDDLKDKVDELRFRDIFVARRPKNETDVTKMCKSGFTPVNTDVDWECLKLKEGMEMYASRFETRRYAAVLGATTEWNKWEGITYSPRRRRLYTAMSSIEKGMEDFSNKGQPSNQFDIGGPNHLRLEYNPCGCVYAMDVDDNMWASLMYPVVCGKSISGDPNNRCALDSVSNPDNVAMVEEHDGLLIGEDTSRHQNDVVWYMDLKTRTMSRIFSTPYGSETTGPYWHADINGWSYMVMVVQHPYGESDKERRFDAGATGVEGWIGYIGPIDSELSVN